MVFKGASTESVPKHERHFYATHRAFGRLGMRIFAPAIMELPHWHGHVELNLLTGADMRYEFDGETIDVADGEPVIFWAGIPHQLCRLTPRRSDPASLANLYMPVDAFLSMPHIAPLQVALLGGALVRLPSGSISPEQMARWYADYRSGKVDRMELLKMEINAVLRRSQIDGYDFLRRPIATSDPGRSLTSSQVQHVVKMLRFVLENLTRPLVNSDVTRVTGLHENYALSLFSRTMRVSLKRFIIQMRLIRARAALIESTQPITTVATESGFASISQFYAHFKASYGLAPNAMRQAYVGSVLR